MPEQTQLQDVNNSAEAAAYIADLALDLAHVGTGLMRSVSSWTWRTSKRRR